MQADCFYQLSLEHAIPMVLLTEKAPLPEDDRQSLSIQQFKGRLGQVGLICDATGALSHVYIGQGHANNDAAAIAHAVKQLPPGSYRPSEPLSPTACLTWSLAQYQFDRYKKHTKPPRQLALTDAEAPNLLTEADAVFMIRDLINTPTNDMGPAEMADVVAALAYEHEGDFKQWIGDDLLTHNFPAIHAVGRASIKPPRLLSLTWGDETHPKVTLIGKGVCFDSGGLDIKSAASMRLMKKDMGGAAQVIGLAKYLMMRELPIYLTVLIPAVENAVGSNAYRPGDVLTMRNGLTVEIDNTDAEGRLVVADAMVYACESHPDLLIDFTTLTGAARVAVGTEISAMFTPSDALAQSLMDAGNKVTDPIWRLPLFAGYAHMLDSPIADLSNSSPSSYAGAITAALFLQRFLKKEVDWVHFDVMAWNVSNKPGKPEGGEAMGCRAVADYLMGRYGA